MLTKISNSPILLKATADQARIKAQQSGDTVKRDAIEEALTLLPERAQVEDVTLSGKLGESLSLPKMLTLLCREALCLGSFTASVAEGALRPFRPLVAHLTRRSIAHRGEVYHSVSLHLNVEYHRSLLQEEVIHVSPSRWVRVRDSTVRALLTHRLQEHSCTETTRIRQRLQ